MAKLARRDKAAGNGAEHLPISELATQSQGALSPFGGELQLPLPLTGIRYQHPGADERPRLVVDQQ